MRQILKNKLFLLDELPPPESYQPYQLIDMGALLSEVYEKDKAFFLKQVSFDAAEYFKSLVDKVLSNEIARIVFTNFGILQEKDFSLNIQKFFLDYAKYFNVFLYWPYEVDNMEYLKWSGTTTNNNGIHFDNKILQRAII